MWHPPRPVQVPQLPVELRDRAHPRTIDGWYCLPSMICHNLKRPPPKMLHLDPVRCHDSRALYVRFITVMSLNARRLRSALPVDRSQSLGEAPRPAHSYLPPTGERVLRDGSSPLVQPPIARDPQVRLDPRIRSITVGGTSPLGCSSTWRIKCSLTARTRLWRASTFTSLEEPRSNLCGHGRRCSRLQNRSCGICRHSW